LCLNLDIRNEKQHGWYISIAINLAFTIDKFFASMNDIFCYYSLDIKIRVNAAIANALMFMFTRT